MRRRRTITRDREDLAFVDMVQIRAAYRRKDRRRLGQLVHRLEFGNEDEMVAWACGRHEELRPWLLAQEVAHTRRWVSPAAGAEQRRRIAVREGFADEGEMYRWLAETAGRDTEESQCR